MKHDWSLRKVGELFNVQLGKMLSPRARKGEQFPYLANFNVQWGKFNLETVKSMHFTESEKEKYSLKQGDILMCEGGEVGRCAIWKERSTNFYYQEALHRLRPKDKNTINPYFMCIYMEHVTANNGVTKIVGETSIAHLTREKLCALKIPCPPKDQQDKIVKTISTWDAAIDKTERLIAAKEKQFKWLLKLLISDQQDNPKWRKVKLNDVGVVSSAGVDKKTIEGENSVRLVNYLDVLRKDFISSNDLGHWVTAPARKLTQCDVRKGDVFFTPSSEVRGDIAHSAVAVEDIEKAVHSYHIVRFRLYENWDTVFRAYAFKSSYFYKQAYRMCEGSGQRYVISQDDFRGMTICIPNIEKQRKIAQTLRTRQKEIDLLKQIAEQHRTQKRGLMQKLLKGEWRAKA